MNLPPHACKRLCLLAFLLPVLGGCTALPAAGPAEGGFDLRGKIGVVYGEESFSARFLWRQQYDRFTIDLWGPLGQGRVQLSGNPEHLELREADGTLISRGPPEAVMNRHLGWSLPLSVLPQWVRGRPAPGIPVRDRVRDAEGRLSAFRQLGWQVELERYRDVAAALPADAAGSGPDTVSLPYRVTAAQQGYRVRLAVTEWQVAAPPASATGRSSR